MSLHVYTDRKDIPNDMLVVDDNDVFFNSHTVLNNSDFEQMVLKNIDQDFLKGAIAEESFPGMFFANCRDQEIAAYIRSVLEK